MTLRPRMYTWGNYYELLLSTKSIKPLIDLNCVCILLKKKNYDVRMINNKNKKKKAMLRFTFSLLPGGFKILTRVEGGLLKMH